MLTASGGMPGELHGGWRTGIVKHDGSPTSGATMDLEYGFSCMGYEVVAPWGAAIARAQTHPDGLVTALFGDGSYLMLNSELYSAAFAGHPYVSVLCDNSGFAVIHRLQTNQGAEGFNNMLADSRGPGADGSVHVDFAAHARSLGCIVEDVPADGRRRRPACGVRTRAERRPRAASSGRRGLPHALLDVDRGRRLVGDRRAAVAQRTRVVRREQGGPAAMAVRLVGSSSGTAPADASSTRRSSRRPRASSSPESSPARRERRAEVDEDWPGVPVFDSLGALLASGVDAVTITTPPETRRELVLEAAGGRRARRRGQAVRADRRRRAGAGAAAADSAGVLLSVFHNRRWDADIRTLAAVVESGRLGELWRVHSRFDLDDPATLEAGPGGGLLRDIGSHVVDQMIWLLGDVRSVNAHLDWLDLPDGRTDACVPASTSSTPRACARTVESSKANHLEARELRAYGSEGSYRALGTDVQAQAIFAGRRPVDDLEEWGYEEPARWGVLATAAGEVSVPSEQGRYHDFYTAFAAASVARAGSRSRRREDQRTLAVLDAARLSAERGESVQVPP